MSRWIRPFLWTLLTISMGGIIAVGGACSADRASAAHEVVVDGPTELATFAGGCFWCMEPPFEKLKGVRSVISGFTGGPEVDPTYKMVAGGKTGHTEAVQINFNPEVVSYDQLLDVYWRSMDPTDAGGQFADRGRQYRPGIFFHSPTQRDKTLASKQALSSSGRFDKPIVIEITAYSAFYAAEEYHQDYYRKRPTHYKSYRKGSGREGFLKKVWGSAAPPVDRKRFTEASKVERLKDLTPLQYRVTQKDGTERPFKNLYWDNKAAGIYVDIVSGEPLFSSKDKFRSGTGWPSFVRPLVVDNIVRLEDRSLFPARVEIRSKQADSHLGHVFKDGPAPTGLRYCINSASLRFVGVDDLKAAGYGELESLFKAPSAGPRH